MKLLLDTQLLLWAAGQPDRLSVEARESIENIHNVGGSDKKHARALIFGQMRACCVHGPLENG